MERFQREFSQKSIVEKNKRSGVKISKTAVFSIINCIGKRRNHKLVGLPSPNISQHKKIGESEIIRKVDLMTNKENPPSHRNTAKALKVSKTTVGRVIHEDLSKKQSVRQESSL